MKLSAFSNNQADQDWVDHMRRMRLEQGDGGAGMAAAFVGLTQAKQARNELARANAQVDQLQQNSQYWEQRATKAERNGNYYRNVMTTLRAGELSAEEVIWALCQRIAAHEGSAPASLYREVCMTRTDIYNRYINWAMRRGVDDTRGNWQRWFALAPKHLDQSHVSNFDPRRDSVKHPLFNPWYIKGMPSEMDGTTEIPREPLFQLWPEDGPT